MTSNEIAGLFAQRMNAGQNELYLSAKQVKWLFDQYEREHGRGSTTQYGGGSYGDEGKRIAGRVSHVAKGYFNNNPHHRWTVSLRPNGAGLLKIGWGATFSATEAEARRYDQEAGYAWE